MPTPDRRSQTVQLLTRVACLMLLCLAALAGCTPAEDPEQERLRIQQENRVLRQELQQQSQALAESRKAESRAGGLLGFALAAAVVLFVVGTALGSVARKDADPHRKP